jgi:two-component system sensor histidine kinase YesM
VSDQTLNVPGLPYGLRKRLTAVFLVIILAFSVLNAFNLTWIGLFYRQLSFRLTRQANLQELISEIREQKTVILNYSRSLNPEYLSKRDTRKNRIQSLLESELNAESLGFQTRYRVGDIERMIMTLDETEDRMIEDTENGLQTIYVKVMGDNLLELSDFIIAELQLLTESYTRELGVFYQEFSRRMSRMTLLSLVLLFLAMIAAIYTARRFLLSVSRPIHLLAMKLVKFGDGDMETRVGEIGGKDEIAILGRSFDLMADRIRNLIRDIRDKADLEIKLGEQLLASQEVERLLKEAELAHLHAQINPHFLFNTLNILGSLSVLEKAPRTGRTISDLSELLRYSLRTGSGMVTLKDEADIVRSYMAIQTLRFDEKIRYQEDIDPSLERTEIPGMILQPLAENAVKHGLELIERNGTVHLTIRRSADNVEIILADDGIGISDRALALLEEESIGTESLGIRNVRRRLQLHYGQDVLSVARREKGGTECGIIIPLNEIG